MSQIETPYLGLAPFLRMNIAGTDLRPIAQEMLTHADAAPDDANLWMNLSILMQCLGHRDLGLTMQAQALSLTRGYHIAAAQQPAKLRLLLLMAPGDLSANTPLDCLLENSDIDLDFYFMVPGDALDLPLPEHDALMVAIGESDQNSALLAALEPVMAHWPRPVINAAQNILRTERNAASRLLQHAPGLRIPPTLRVTRQRLHDVATGAAILAALFEDCDFPIILRPVGSHAGIDLDKIERPEEIAAYLDRVGATDFFVSRFIDYSGKDGLFRKFRIALIAGEAFACHMAVSSDWMVHYVNAGMYEDAQKREEEAAFMAHFDAFVQRHRAALDAIYTRADLDYMCVDCAETQDGQLLVFEIDHAMVVHAMDQEQMFPYKQQPMQKVKTAFRDLLVQLTSASDTEHSDR